MYDTRKKKNEEEIKVKFKFICEFVIAVYEVRCIIIF